MVALFKKAVNFCIFSSHRNIHTSYSIFGYWNKDWLADSYPQTKEKCKAAAQKYNLHPKEYVPYPDDGFGYGDYPKLPFQGVALRDPHYPYDNPEHRRNFNEAVHIDIDILGEDRYDAGAKERYPIKYIIPTFLLIFGGLYGSCYISEYIPMFQPVAEKQYPWRNKVYHQFEKKNHDSH